MAEVDPHAYPRLAELRNRLEVYRFDMTLRGSSLVVVNTRVDGCCEQTHRPADTITCRRRKDDGDRWWYWTSWGHPIAEVDHVIDAAVFVASYLHAT